jgi:hypothetical protein
MNFKKLMKKKDQYRLQIEKENLNNNLKALINRYLKKDNS